MTAKKEAPAVKRLTLIVGAAALGKAIASIKARGAKLDSDIHVAAVSTLAHSAQHNDPDMMTRMLDSLGKSARRQALIAWTLNYGAFKQDAAGKLVYDVSRREAVLSEDNMKACEAEPFWDFAPEPVYRQFDLAAALAALLKKADAALTNSAQDTALISPAVLASLKALVEPQAAE